MGNFPSRLQLLLVSTKVGARPVRVYYSSACVWAGLGKRSDLTGCGMHRVSLLHPEVHVRTKDGGRLGRAGLGHSIHA